MDRVPESIKRIIDDYIINLKARIPIEKVVLFGSYAKNTAHAHSDVDIAIFSDYFKKMSRVDSIYFLLLSAVDYDIDIEPQGFTMEEYNNPVGLVYEIVNTGVELTH